MTFLSIVLPCYKVQGYLRHCLDSLLSQPFGDFEVIAVDDRSPDHTGEILAEYAARDSRVRVVTPPENLGLGRARNLGLEHATGEYVWFIDSDDWLGEDVLSAVAARLRETDPDMLIVGWDRVHWDGRVENGPIKMLSNAPDVFTAGEWLASIRVLHVAWNRIMRRELLTRLNYQFAIGWYEDVSFTFPMLVAAQRISTLPLTCVHYRQRRTGAITRTVSDRHFEVFDHWNRAMELIATYGPPAPEVGGWIFRRMIWHLLRVVLHEDRLSAGSRKQFFDRMTEMYHRYLPATGFPPPPGRAERIRFELVERNNYPAFRTFAAAIDARKELNTRHDWAQGIKSKVKRRSNHPYYQAQLRLPIDETLVVYAAYWFRGVSCNPAAIAAKAAELAPHLRHVWVVNQEAVADLPPGTDYVVPGTLPYYRALARARWLVNNVNWPNWIIKRPGATHVMTHHGTPLKVMGVDQPDNPKDPYFHNQMRRSDRWDFSITPNAHTTIAFERAYPCAYETLETGYPRNDRLANATAEEVSGVREKLGLDPAKRVVLYMPTHRDWMEKGQQDVLDVAKLAERLGPDTVLIDRSHYFNREGPAAPVEDLYLAADVLITDYSSAMFDYAVLDRPIVIFAPDWEEYREKRGVYFDLMELPPGAVATDESALAEVLNTDAYRDEKAAAARLAFRARFCYLEDGGASERVVRRVFL